MGNTGKELEQLVKYVEEVFLPKGFTVTLNQKVFDEDGNQIAELDLIISGQLSTTKISWLIECRDRPSQGAAPVSWIEQLVGRRMRFQFNKVTAVSTTGFAPGAVEFANESGIELRTVGQITRSQIENWFSIEEIAFSHTIGDLKHVGLTIDNESVNVQDEQELKEIFSKFNSDSMVFINTRTNETVSANNIWEDVMNQTPNLIDNVVPNGEPRRKKVEVNFTNPEGRYAIKLQTKIIHVLSGVFIADVRTELTLIPISKITKYSIVGESQSIAESVHFDLPIGDGKLNLVIQKLNEQDGNRIAVISRKE